MANESRDDLKEYILRALGKPVINIELDTTQIDDRIDDTLQLFIKRHYLGVEESHFSQTLSYQDILDNNVTLASDIRGINEVFSPSADSNTLNASGVRAFDSLEYQMQDAYNSNFSTGGAGVLDYYLAKEHFSTIRHLFNTRKQFSHSTVSHKLIPLGWKFKDITRYNLLKSGRDLSVTSDWSLLNSSIDADSIPLPNGTLSADKVISTGTSSAFGVTQVIDRKYYSVSDYSMSIILKSEEYTGNVIVSVKDESGDVLAVNEIILTDYFNTSYLKFKTKVLNKAKLTIEVISSVAATTATDGFSVSSIAVWKNPDLVLKGYKAVSEEDSDLWNDDFVKRYSVAVCGMQWADNLSKFAGVQLPGAITLDGPTLYSKYLAERDEIMSDFENSAVLPLDPIIA